MKPLSSGHLLVFKNFSVTERCPLLEGNLPKIVTFGTKQFARCSRHVHIWVFRHWEVSLYKSCNPKGKRSNYFYENIFGDLDADLSERMSQMGNVEKTSPNELMSQM